MEHPHWDVGFALQTDPSTFEVRFDPATAGRPAFRVRFEAAPDWRLIGSEPTRWTNGPLATELTVSSAPNGGHLTLTQVNQSSQTVALDLPALEVTSDEPLTHWLGGASNYVARVDEGRVVALRPLGGAYTSSALANGVIVRPQHAQQLAPGQEHLSVWSLRAYDSAENFRVEVTPVWYPATAVVDAGDEIALRHLDGVVNAPDLDITTDYPLLLLSGPPGIHPVSVLEASGGSTTRLGWAPPLEDLVRDALAQDELAPDLRAWFTCWRLHRTPMTDAELDALDALLGEALARATPFAVAAAADAVPLLGRGLLTDAVAALGTLLDAPTPPDGTHLAGLRLYAQSLVAGSSAGDGISGALWSSQYRSSMEAELLSDPTTAAGHAQALASSLGYGLPGHVPSGRAREVALLKLALAGTLPPERIAFYAQLHLDAERWQRAARPSPDQLAWLLW